MIIVKGNFHTGLEISDWLRSQGLVHEKDYTWYRRSKSKEHEYDCVVFTVADPKWETLIGMRWL